MATAEMAKAETPAEAGEPMVELTEEAVRWAAARGAVA